MIGKIRSEPDGFHELWGQAKASPEYDKKKWIAFQSKILRLVPNSTLLREAERKGAEEMREGCAAEIESHPLNTRDLLDSREGVARLIRALPLPGD